MVNSQSATVLKQWKDYLKNRLGAKRIMAQVALENQLPRVSAAAAATSTSVQPSIRVMFVMNSVDPDSSSAPAMQLLNKIIEAMGLLHAEIFISQMPSNSDVSLSKIQSQITELKPQVVVALGDVVLGQLCGNAVTLLQSRGQFLEFNGIKLMPTYQPSHLLSNPAAKKDVWEDMKKVMAYLKK